MNSTQARLVRFERISSQILARRDVLAVSAILAAVFLWGASFAAMRVAVQVLSPWSVMWLRMIIATVLLIPLAGKLIPSDYRKGDWKLLIPMVLFQPCLYFLLESYALRFTTSSQAGVISAAVPLMVAFGARLVLSEAIPRAALLGLVLSLLGVACLTLLQGAEGAATNPLLGNTLELCAMASAAANMIVVKRLCQRYNPWSLTAMQVSAGAIFFLPGLYLMTPLQEGFWTPQLVLILLFLGSFVTLGAFGLYNWGMSHIPASRASAFINLVPVNAVFFGWILLGEGLTLPQCTAALAVIGGVWLSQKSRRRVPLVRDVGCRRSGSNDSNIND